MSAKIYQSTVNTPIGTLTIMGDEEAINIISFASIDDAELTPNKLTTEAATQLTAYFNGTLTQFNFPFYQAGTEFQQDVWQRLLNISYGTTISYANFSAHHPLAIRAIAAANGKNNLAIVVPCHRVIGSNGKLVGYAGGLDRKRWLLEHEMKVAGIGQASLPF